MKEIINVGELRSIIKESSREFKARIGKNVESDNKRNNEQSYKESRKRAENFDGATLDKKIKKNKIDRSDDVNRTTLGYTPSNEVSKEYKDRIKAQAKGYTSVEQEKKGSKDHNAEMDDDARIYNSIKDNETKKNKAKSNLAHSGIVSSKMEKKEKNNMFENKTPKTKRLIFKKTVFMNENQMLSRIPEEYKIDGQKIYMKDKVDNEYIVEFSQSKRSGLLETYVIGFNNQRVLNEQVDRIHKLFEYDSAKAKGNTSSSLKESAKDNFSNMFDTIRKMNEEIDMGQQGEDDFDDVNKWRTAANEIQTKGSTIINIPIEPNNFVQAKLMKTQRGGIYLETNNLRKEYPSISDAFSALRGYVKEGMI